MSSLHTIQYMNDAVYHLFEQEWLKQFLLIYVERFFSVFGGWIHANLRINIDLLNATLCAVTCPQSALIHQWNTIPQGCTINTLRPRQNGRYFPDDIFKCIFLKENVWIPIKISLKFVPKSPINNIPALVQIMAWRRPGDKPLSEPMLVRLPTHICVTWPQWVNTLMPDATFVHLASNHFIKQCRIICYPHLDPQAQT